MENHFEYTKPTLKFLHIILSKKYFLQQDNKAWKVSIV